MTDEGIESASAGDLDLGERRQLSEYDYENLYLQKPIFEEEKKACEDNIRKATELPAKYLPWRK